MSRCSCGSVTPMLTASTAPSTVSALPESAPSIAFSYEPVEYRGVPRLGRGAPSVWGLEERPGCAGALRTLGGVEERPGCAGALRTLGGLGGHFGAPHLMGRPVGLDVAAPSTRPQLEARVEALDGGLEVLLDVAHVHRDLVQ